MFEHLFFRVSGGLGFFLANIGRSGFSFTEHQAVPVFNKVKIRAGGRTFRVTIKVHEVLKSQERRQKLISHKGPVPNPDLGGYFGVEFLLIDIFGWHAACSIGAPLGTLYRGQNGPSPAEYLVSLFLIVET